MKDTHNVPKKWSRVGSAPAEHSITLNIGLKQDQFAELERHLYEVSTPSHARYGKHLTTEEVNALVAPSRDALSDVHDWLQDEGINSAELSYTPAKDWISVKLPVKSIEKLLDTKYSVYKHEDGTHLVRAPTWSLPTHLHNHIDTIQPTNSFFRPNARKSTLKTVKPIAEIAKEPARMMSTALKSSKDLTVAQACNTSAVTPTCLRTLYGTIDYVPKVPGKNQVALNNYLGEANNRSDVSIFLQRFRPDAVSAAQTFTVNIVNGGDNQQTPDNATQLAAGKDLEGNLDAETILGIDYPTPLTTYNTGGMPPFIADANTPTDTNEPYLTWLQYVLAQENIPQVISSSYGDDEQTIPFSYAKSVCNQFAQLGARGVTFLCSSGDDGVGATGACFTNDGKNTSTFLPSFPDGCPYVTSVGATKNFNPEVAAFDPRNNFASGGGFSNYFPRPAYQNTVVPGYISSLGTQFSGLYNKTGRGYPDIAAQGQRFVTIWNGTVVLLDGTSASTPTAAGVLTLVNDALIAAGKSPLGFLNPALYGGLYKAFTDVTSGSAIGCNSTGFPAKTGWDAVTGFGTPYFPSVSAAALNGTNATGVYYRRR